MEGGDRIKTINTKQYGRLELFLKNTKEDGCIVLIDQSGNVIKEPGGEGFYKWLKIDLKKEENYQIIFTHAEVSIAYLSGNEKIMEEGVCFLEFSKEQITLEGRAFSEFYNTSYREQYHFVPIKNWVNDPNGLCWYQGYYHLFFQTNPHQQEWNDMYWGHAASKDLIHWVHLPFVLEPQQCLYGNPNLKGGAFSGCAVAEENEVLFYLTRHEGPQEDCDETQQWQTMTSSKDMLTFEEETVIIREKPDGVGYDFRDPKVSCIHGTWYMVLACNYKGNSAMLLYQSEDKRDWKYIKPIIIEPDKGSTTFECPDFFTLDGKQVGVAALMKHHDEHKRFQMTKYYIGTLEADEFHIEHTGWYDFGSNFYAVQSFEHEGRRIAIGWISDFYGEHVEVEQGAYGSFSLPRELRIVGGKLYMEPVSEVKKLRNQKIYYGSKENITLDHIEGNSYYLHLVLSGETEFCILLGKDGEKSISLLHKNGVTKLQTKGVKTEQVEFVADVKEVEEIEVFVDRRLIEVFINKGEAAGAKVFYNTTTKGVLETTIEQPEMIQQIEVYTMHSIWK